MQHNRGAAARHKRARGLVVAAGTVGLLGAGLTAVQAQPVSTGQGASSYQTTCLYWSVTGGAKPGSINLCGQVSQSGTFSYRTVRAQRWVQTCDANDQCTNSYSELYEGVADNNQFTMDPVAGTASFNLTLPGENGASCPVRATAHATDSYSPGGSPYPFVQAYANPSAPYASVQQGNTRYDASVNTNPSYPYASLSQNQAAKVNRQAAGSGTVCDWVETQSPGTGSIWSDSNSTTWYSVTPTQLG